MPLELFPELSSSESEVVPGIGDWALSIPVAIPDPFPSDCLFPFPIFLFSNDVLAGRFNTSSDASSAGRCNASPDDPSLLPLLTPMVPVCCCCFVLIIPRALKVNPAVLASPTKDCIFIGESLFSKLNILAWPASSLLAPLPRTRPLPFLRLDLAGGGMLDDAVAADSPYSCSNSSKRYFIVDWLVGWLVGLLETG